MILLTVGNDIIFIVILAYVVLHLPAFIMLGIGLGLRKKKPKTSKTLLILAAVYFVIGAGVCTGMF